MSVRSPLLASLPSNTGEPVSVEFIEGTGKRRITRRFSMTSGLVTPGNLLQAVGPYGTADGATWTGLVKARPADGAKVYPDAKLVDARIVSAPARSPEQGGADAMLRWVEVVYEETVYELTTGTETDAQGAIISISKTVVCAVGDALPAAPVGYSRVLVGMTADAGRLRYAVRDVRGDGVISKGFSEGSDGVIEEDGSYTTMTSPSDPTPGEFDSWRSVAEGGYWRVSYSRMATAQLPAPGRVRRTKDSRPDGSVSQSVTESGEDPACAHDFSGGTVIQVGQSDFTRSGGIVGRTRHYLRLPTDRSQSTLVNWTRPGLVTLGGTLGTGGDAWLRVEPPVQQRIVGTAAWSWGVGLTADAPWKADYWFGFYVGGVTTEGMPFSRQETHPNCLGDVSIAGSSGKWCGVEFSSIAGSGWSSPEVRPTGTQVIDSDVRAYAADIDGVVYFEKITTSATVS